MNEIDTENNGRFRYSGCLLCLLQRQHKNRPEKTPHISYLPIFLFCLASRFSLAYPRFNHHPFSLSFRSISYLSMHFFYRPMQLSFCSLAPLPCLAGRKNGRTIVAGLGLLQSRPWRSWVKKEAHTMQDAFLVGSNLQNAPKLRLEHINNFGIMICIKELAPRENLLSLLHHCNHYDRNVWKNVCGVS